MHIGNKDIETNVFQACLALQKTAIFNFLALKPSPARLEVVFCFLAIKLLCYNLIDEKI